MSLLRRKFKNRILRYLLYGHVANMVLQVCVGVNGLIASGGAYAPLVSLAGLIVVGICTLGFIRGTTCWYELKGMRVDGFGTIEKDTFVDIFDPKHKNCLIKIRTHNGTYATDGRWICSVDSGSPHTASPYVLYLSKKDRRAVSRLVNDCIEK
jgi:hypothetical protein